jgi:hypothetical protein
MRCQLLLQLRELFPATIGFRLENLMTSSLALNMPEDYREGKFLLVKKKAKSRESAEWHLRLI